MRTLLINSALASGLVTQAQIDAAVDALKSQPDAPPAPLVAWNDEQLADQLVEDGVLTSYQAEQLKSGRTKLKLGPYLIIDWIGQGGMGQVFLAKDEIMGREVAVKVLPRDRSTPQAIENFHNEIRTQAQLDHPNIVRAYTAGHDGNVHYLVTEYVPGTDLRRLVRTQGPLTMQQATAVILQAARGLQYAHDRGFVHRDVKPGNILVTPEGTAKVSDLGLSGKFGDPENDPRSGKIVGTADYLSPEQILHPNDVGPPADVYGLGCTLYYALTGKVPFPGGTAKDKARRHCEETPWHPRRFAPDLDEELVEVIADMMEKDSAQRMLTAADVVVRMQTWAGGSGPRAVSTLTKSPWTAPPLPTEADEMDDTALGLDGGDSISHDSPSQTLQGTVPIGSSAQETSSPDMAKRPAVPSIPYLSEMDTTLQAVLIALAVAVPVSMLFGALLMFGLIKLIS